MIRLLPIIALLFTLLACSKEVSIGPASPVTPMTGQVVVEPDVAPIRGCVYSLKNYRAATCGTNTACTFCCTTGATPPTPPEPLASCKIKLPDFSTLQPSLKVAVSTFDCSQFNFPDELKDWYGISYSAQIVAPTCGMYQFWLNSTGGSKLFIDGITVVDNDGEHPLQTSTGQIFMCSDKPHPMKLDYFKGVGTGALELYWKVPGATSPEKVPATAFVAQDKNAPGCLNQ